jgi:conjugal transfer pilus assembly protein TraF
MKSSTELIRFCSVWAGLLLLTQLVHVHGSRAAQVDLSAAFTANPAPGFYNAQPRQGWYWYKNTLAKKKKKTEADQPPAIGNYSEKQLFYMYPDQFQKLLKERLKTAVQNPTEENVQNYLNMQDIARRKAAAFTAAVQFVNQKEAARYSLNNVYPRTTPGIEERVLIEQKEIGSTIVNARKDHAILFFWRPDCGFCQRQIGILQYFTQKYHWQIKPINITEQPELVERFNIIETPTLLVIKKGNQKYMPLSVGVISLDDMERKLYRAIRYLNGDTGIDTFTTMQYQKGSPLDPGSILKNSQGGPR